MILRRRIMVLGGGDSGDYVDLGLPSGLLWAKGNLIKNGTTGEYAIGNETDWGTYVSWGNIDGHNEGEGYNFNQTTYNSTPGNQVSADIPPTDTQHDICAARLGSPWHLPTKKDFQELYNNTDFEWVDDYNGTGVPGCKLMKKSDHSVYVFFPASGHYWGNKNSTRGNTGIYWSSSFNNDTYAYRLTFNSSSINPPDSNNRHVGSTVRPVCKLMFSITITLEGEDVEGITLTVRDSEGISHSGITNSNGVVRLTGVAGGSAKVSTKDYYVTNSHITVSASSRTFTCGLEQRESKYLTFEALESGTFKFTNPLSYSTNNGSSWVSLAANTKTPTVSAGSKIMFKATLTPSSSGIGTFSSTGRFNAIGNPMSLLYGDNFSGQTDLTGKDYAFYKLFEYCTNLVSAENLALPATTLANYCYQYMFKSCSSLTTAPQLPATTLATYCYSGMFGDCMALTTAPTLSATTLTDWCYHAMFWNCTGLTNAPNLPATTLAPSCYYNMFSTCKGLTTIPSNLLPATTLAPSCYCQMFEYCTLLTTAPELPATTLATSCYYGMFNGCSSLNSITCLATDISASNCTNNWVNRVAASGTFTKAASMSGWTRGNSGIPSGWTVQNA